MVAGRFSRQFCQLLFALGALLGIVPGRLVVAAEDSVEFNRDIRPMLSDNCFTCHGPDGRQRQAGLRLDNREAAMAKLESGEAGIVPGKSTESELVRRVRAKDDDLRMPPPESNKQLNADQIALLERWIDSGAQYQGHWSFLPIERPELSDATDSWAKTPFDKLVLAELMHHKLKPSSQAEPSVLARRVAMDLTGLPPTAEQVARLTKDSSDASYEKLVDELLASPRYGERMALWWLDLVRYADSVGYHGDQPISVYPFREYVIRAFNDNKPFDQFTVEQLAGDLLPNATIDHKIASGYNRLGMMSAEGGVQDKEYLTKYAAERVRNLGGTWLGLTLGCAECHDHKFDPTTTKEFYQFEAFFADIQERGAYQYNNAINSAQFGASLQLPTPEQKAELERLDAEIAALKKQLDTNTPELAAAQIEWEKSVLPQIVEWKPLKPTKVESSMGGATLSVLDDASILASGPNPTNDTYTVTVASPPAAITALRIELLPHHSLPGNGPGRANNGNLVLTELTVNQRGPDGVERPVVLTNPSASFEQDLGGTGAYDRWTAAAVIDGDEKGARWGWAIMPQFGKANRAVFETKEDTTVGQDGLLTLVFRHSAENAQHNIGHFRIWTTTAPRPVRVSPADELPENVRALVKLESAKRNEAQQQELAKYYRSIAPLLGAVHQKLPAVEKARTALSDSLSSTLITVAATPRTIRVLPRGNWMDDSGLEVQPAVPAFLPPLPAKEGRPTRLDLAHWLTARDNPLTSRVLENRLIKLFFGAGISRKLDDLGAQGEWPTHPKLLDWLAADLMDHGWDLKHSIKSIVMSATYRQSSLVSPELREKDPFNRWLARQGRFRLDAELVRDNTLWISGLLVERIGGPSAKPYQPARYWAYLNFPEREYEADKGDGLYRRGLYTHWQRQYLHPSLLAFDAPSREECSADRPRSNTPLQALVLLNDPTYVEAARVFAELVLREGGSSTAERFSFAFRRALQRDIRPAETTLLEKLLAKHQEYYRQNADAAQQLLNMGAHKAASDLPPAELAAWTSIARAVLNLHEVITRN